MKRKCCISYLLFLARSVAQQAEEERAGLILGGMGAVDGVTSLLIRFHKNEPGSISYLLFLARSVAQQAKEERAGLLLGGVGSVDGVNSFLIRFHKNEPWKFLTTCCSSPDLSRSKPKKGALVFF
jgi:chemotaxis response regulator CheB